MAKVDGTFYTAERLRRGTSPVSPPYAEDEGQPYPVNPPGSGVPSYITLSDTKDGNYLGKNGFVPVVTNEDGLTLTPLPQVAENGLISGGIVQWSGVGYIFNVSGAFYRIGGVLYESPAVQITLDAPDATNNRIDVFAVSNAGVAVDITGTPSGSPVKPQIDPSTQLELTSVIVTASTTEPTLTEEVIYDENTEWTGSSTGTGTANFASTNDPYQGTVSVETTNIQNAFYIEFDNGSTIDVSGFQTLGFQLKLKSAMPANQNLIGILIDGSGNPASSSFSLSFDKLSTDYQFVGLVMSGIPIVDFDIRYIRFVFIRTGGAPVYPGFFLDILKFEGGINPPVTVGSFLGLSDTPSTYSGQASKVVSVKADESGLEFKSDVQATGASFFGGIVYNSTTTVDIGAVKGFIFDNETDPDVPTLVPVEYPATVGVSVTTVGSGTRSYGLLKSDGTIHFQNAFPSSEDRKKMIYLFKVGHPSGSITTVANEPDFVLSTEAQFRDLFQAINYVNQGVYPYPSASDLTFNTSAGPIIGNGINFVTDNLNPNTLQVAGTTPCSFFYRTQTGAGGSSVTDIEPNNYDNSGTITAIGGGSNRSTIQYIHYAPNAGFIVQYGQTIYDSLVDAIASVGKEDHVVYDNLIRDSILIGVLALKRSTSDLTNTDDARFFRADIFGQLVGSAAGTSVTTLQRAYLNSIIPQIETTIGALTLKNGGGADTDSVVSIQNLAAAETFAVRGDGVISEGTISPYQLIQEGATDGDVLTWVAANSRYEPVAGGGGGSKWTDGTGFIYRNGAVSIGQTSITANTTFEVKSLTATASDVVLSVLKNGGSTAFKIIENGGINIPSTNIALGGTPFSSTGDGLRYRASGALSTTTAFLIEDSAGASMFRVLGDKTVTMFGSRVLIGNPSTFTLHGLTLKSSDNSNSNFAFEVQNSSSTQIMLLRASGIFLLPTARHAFGTTSANVVNGCYFKGSSTSLSIFEIANSSDSVKFRVYGNGNLEIGDAGNVILGTTTGTKIGTTTSQKLAFWNKTPIIQPTTAITGATLVGGGGTTITDTDTFGGYTLQQIAAALINTGLLE